ncbi:MAG: O-antigen ligase family protein [Candidatus Gracilibacteria bacterium]
MTLKNLNTFLLLANLFLLQSYLVRFNIGGYPSNLQEILIGLNVLVFLIWTIKEKKIRQTIFAIKDHKIISSFILLTAISMLIVPIVQYLDFIRYGKFLFFAVVYSFMFLESFRTDDERDFAIKIGGIGAVVFGLFSIVFNAVGFNTTNDLRLNGPLDSAVYLAFYLAPFFIYFAIRALENFKQKLNIIFAAILMILIILTRSMGTIGGTFLVLAVYTLKRSDLNIFKKRFAKIAFALLGILVAGTIFYTKILPTIQTDYSSLSERGQIWQTSVYLLKDWENLLLGVGVGQFQYFYETTVTIVLNGGEPLDYKVLQPHNIFFLFILNYGLLGLIFLLACGYKLYKNIVRNSRQTNEKTDTKTISNFVVFYLFLHGLIDTPFFKNDLLLLLILFMEMGLLYLPKPETKSFKTE